MELKDGTKLEVSVIKLDGREDKLRGFASITVNDIFVIRNITIMEGTEGKFVSMPSRRIEKDGFVEYKDVAFILNPQVRSQVFEEILKKYDSAEPYKKSEE